MTHSIRGLRCSQSTPVSAIFVKLPTRWDALLLPPMSTDLEISTLSINGVTHSQLIFA